MQTHTCACGGEGRYLCTNMCVFVDACALIRCVKALWMIHALLLLTVLLTADSYSLYAEIGFACSLISSKLKCGRFVPRVLRHFRQTPPLVRVITRYEHSVIS